MTTQARRISRTEQEEMGMVRKDSSFVAALPPVQRPNTNLAYPLVEAMPTNGEIDAGALRAMESGEKSTPVQRSIGAAITLVALLAAGIIIAWILMEVGAGEGVAVFSFLVCAGIGGWLTYQQVTRYSPSGVEIDKSARYENIRLTEIESNERIALRKLEAYMKVLERVYGNHNDT